MSTSKDDFKKALREGMSSEFSHVPCDEESIEYTFSEDFDKKMDKLIKAQSKSYYFLINTTLKRIAIIVFVFLTLFAATMRVDVVNGTVTNVIIELYERLSEKPKEEKPSVEYPEDWEDMVNESNELLADFGIEKRMQEWMELKYSQTWYPVKSSIKKSGTHEYVLAGCWAIYPKSGTDNLIQIRVRVLNSSPEVISRNPYEVLIEGTGVRKIYLREGFISEQQIYFEYSSEFDDYVEAVVDYYAD